MTARLWKRHLRQQIKSASVCAYYPGMQGGRVLADILFGGVNPSGKLPLSWPKIYKDCPTYKNFPGDGKEVWYGEGIYVGYRYYDAKGIRPLYPFGFGLSYTEFELSDLQLDRTVNVDVSPVQVSVRVKNIGKYAGAEVVQLYVHDKVSRLDKPEKELKGFVKVALEAGEEKVVKMILTKEDLSSYDVGRHQWICEPGEFDILVGNSSENILLRACLDVVCENPFELDGGTSIGVLVANEGA